MLCNSWPVPGRGRVQRGRAEEPTSNGAGQVSVLGQRPLPPRIGMLAERGSPWLHASLAVSDSAPGLSSELGRKGHLCHPVSEAVPGLPSRESSGSLPISVKSSSSVCSSLGAQLWHWAAVWAQPGPDLCLTRGWACGAGGRVDPVRLPRACSPASPQSPSSFRFGSTFVSLLPLPVRRWKYWAFDSFQCVECLRFQGPPFFYKMLLTS